MIRSFRHKGLRRFWIKGDASGSRPDWTARMGRFLDALDAARDPQQMNFPGSGFHELRGNLKGRYAMAVSRNWRLTFGWNGEDAVNLDPEDYRGR